MIVKKITVRKTDSNKKVGQDILMANSFYTRFIGLMFKPTLDEVEGLWLTKTKQIHTCWMRFPIDVIYLKKLSGRDSSLTFEETYQVVAVEEKMMPWRVGKWVSQATDVLELKAGMIMSKHVKIGDILKCMEKID